MSIQAFEKQEAAYLHWVNEHPRGFVLNTKTKLNPKYMVLHRASCKLVTVSRGKTTPGGFTEREYRKICSDDVRLIKAWVSEQDGTLSLCSHCGPEDDELRAYERDLYLRAKEALSDTDARRARLAKAPKQPQAVAATTTLYVRNPDVVAEVLYLASGRCNRCRQDAPFLRRDGTPYLEVHHIVPLSHGGIDAVENAEAVCPNCHRKAHFGVGGTDGN